MKNLFFLVLLLVGGSVLAPLHAAQPADFLAQYQQEARATTPGFTADAARGRTFFTQTHGKEWSCSSCHTTDPRQLGSHAATHRVIQPMAPKVNPQRFTDEAKVNKWFGRNCNDVLGRACTPSEKADVMAYLIGLN